MISVRIWKLIVGFLSVTLFWGSVHAQGLKGLEVLTEAYPPYNFRSEGILKGIAVDLLIAASHKMEAPLKRDDIKLQPWARGYRKALEGPKVALFAMTRTEERDSKFKWAGPISKTRIVVLAKQGSGVTISSDDNLKQYTIGVIRDDIGEQLIRALGVGDSRIQQASNADSLAKKLDAGRIQLWAYEENVARWFIKTNGLANENFVVVHVLKEAELYYAFSKDVDDALVERVQKGVDAVKATPGKIGKTLYDDILSDYL